jgi:hypothetical protein
MIEASISAIKGGFRDLFQTSPEVPRGIASIIRPDSGSPFSVGQEAYVISFQNTGLVCTKCKIIRDVLGGSRVGNIAISILIPVDKKLSGEDIKTLLDKLLNEYNQKYIDKDNNLGSVYEDWTFVNTIITPYKDHLKPNDDTMQSGTDEAAFIYYSTDGELQLYFDDLYQDEYSPYKQVFFVKSDLQAKPENPLNALRHNSNANLTGKIDLDNPKYKLLFNEETKGGIKIEVKIKGSQRYNRNKIRKKDTIEIFYSKRYYQILPVQGKWNAIDSEFVIVNDNEQTVTIKEIDSRDLQPIKKFIPITIIDTLSKEPIPNYRIICKNSYNQSQKEVNSNQYIFEGDEIGDMWQISDVVVKGYTSYEYKFKPDDILEIQIPLYKQRIFTIEVIDKKNNKTFSPNDYELKIFDNKKKTHQYYIENQKNKISFVGNEIEKEWCIEVKKQNYEVSGEQKEMICPRNKDTQQPIKIFIEEKHLYTVNDIYKSGNNQQINSCGTCYFSFKENKNCKISNNNKFGPYDNIEGSTDAAIRAGIKPNFGYKMVGIELTPYKKPNMENHCSYMCEVILKPIISRRTLFSILSILAVVIGIILYLNPLSKKEVPSVNQPKSNKNRVVEYTQGIILDIDTLKSYKEHCADDKLAKIQDNEGESITLGGGNHIEDSDTLCSKIDSAIAIRNAIDEGKIDKLKDKTYSSSQESFGNAIIEINKKFKDKIGQTMKADTTIRKMDLNQIADYITNLQKLLQIREEIKGMTKNDKSKLEGKKTEIDNIRFSVDSIKSNIKNEIDAISK